MPATGLQINVRRIGTNQQLESEVQPGNLWKAQDQNIDSCMEWKTFRRLLAKVKQPIPELKNQVVKQKNTQEPHLLNIECKVLVKKDYTQALDDVSDEDNASLNAEFISQLFACLA